MLGFLGRVAAISVLAIGILYTSSVAYYGGYLQVFSLDADILYRNVDQVLYHGFLFLIPNLVNMLGIFIVANIVFVSVLFFGTLIKYRRFKFVKVNLIKLLLFKFDSANQILKSWLVISLAIFFALFAYIYTLVDFERQGIEAGKEVKTALQKGNVFNLECIEEKGEENKELVISLFCGANTCVGTPLNKSSYIYFDAKKVVISSFTEDSRCGYLRN